MNKYIIEFIGTFFLILVIALSNNPLAIGVVLTALVYMGGYISGANYNPAITLGLFMSKKIKGTIALRYIATQFLASIVASGVYLLITNKTFTPEIGQSSSFLSAFLVEALFTFLLVSVVLHVAATDKTKGNDYYGIAIGLTVMSAAFAGGQISDGVFNPAVGVGPLLFDISHIANHTPSLLLYFTAPFIGGIIASLIYRYKNNYLK